MGSASHRADDPLNTLPISTHRIFRQNELESYLRFDRLTWFKIVLRLTYIAKKCVVPPNVYVLRRDHRRCEQRVHRGTKKRWVFRLPCPMPHAAAEPQPDH